MSVTYKKIAEIAHVSTATVSKALTESTDINDETAAAIRKIAEKLGYFDERRARSPRRSFWKRPRNWAGRDRCMSADSTRRTTVC